MYRRIVFVALLIVFSISCGFGFCQDGQDIKDRWSVGADFAYVRPEDAEYKESPNLLGRASVGCGISNNIAVELEAGSFRLKSKHDSKTTVYTLLTNLELRAKNFGKFVPYLLGGIGWAFFSYDDLHPTEKKDKTSSYAWKTGVGLEYFLNNNWALNFEGAHFYANTGGKTHLDVYGRHYSLGVKYYF